MEPSQPPLIVLACKVTLIDAHACLVNFYFTFVWVIGLDVPDVVPGELVNGPLDFREAALVAHLLSREVCVCARPVPIALNVS